MLLLIGLNFLLHFPFFNTPPNSMHVWRQCNTLAVARNFSEEDMNILKPRVDRRGNSDGVTGMQFPSYEFLLALLYKIFGFHFWLSRAFSFFLFSIGVIFIYLIFEKLFGTGILPAIAASLFTWSPELFYDSILALPDVLALTMYVASFYFFLQWRDRRRLKWFLLFTVSVMLAGLTKLQYSAILVPLSVMVLIELRSGKISGRVAFYYFLVTTAVMAVCIGWYLYAVHLIASSGLTDFGIEFRPAKNMGEALSILLKNSVSDIPELLLNYAGFVLFVTGFIVFISKKLYRHWLFLPLFCWALILLLYHLIELEQMRMHQYYMMLYIPLFLFPMVAGALVLLKKSPVILLILLIACPALAIIRIYPARFLKDDKAVPVALYEESSRIKLSEVVPTNQLTVVGPDESGCIFFYFLIKKGFGFERTEQLFEIENGKMKVENWIAKGGKYLYTNDSVLIRGEKMKPFIKKVMLEEKTFFVAELQPASFLLPLN